MSALMDHKRKYVYASFKECMDMLEDGEIDILGSVSYTTERAESIDFSTYAAGTERYWIYTREDHTDLTDGNSKQMNGCRIGAADGSYQKELLEKWLDSNQIQAEVVGCKGYDEMIEKLDADELDAHENTIRVGYLKDNLPFCGEENGKLTGILGTVLDTVQEKYEITIKAVPCSTGEEMNEELQSGKIDIAGPIIQDFYT